jgi:predicted porin
MKIASLLALTGLAIASASGTVQAQSSVTVYGLMDTGIESISNVGSSGFRLNRVPSNTATIPSRAGFRGREDLGGGLAAIFTLEMGIAPDTGASGQGGRLFGRQALVGLSGDWGAVTLGRQYTMTFWSLLESDVFGPSVYGIGALDAYIPNARADNSIVYRGKFSNVSVGASYSLGRDTVATTPLSPAGTGCAGENGADARACREWSAMVKYDTPAWGAAIAYDRFNGRAVTTAAGLTGPVFGNLDSADKSDTRVMLNGYANIGPVKLGAGVIRRNNEGTLPTPPKSNLLYVGAAYTLSPAVMFDGHIAKLDYKGGNTADATLVAVRSWYRFSKRTSVYAQVGHIRNGSASAVSVSSGAPGSNPAAGGSQTGTMLGIYHSF